MKKLFKRILPIGMSFLALATMPNETSYKTERTEMNIDCSPRDTAPDTRNYTRQEIQGIVRNVWFCTKDKPDYLKEKDLQVIVLQESLYDPKAKSKSNARGLMQLKRIAWNSVDSVREYNRFVFDPAANVENGLRYYSWIEKFVSENNPYWDLLTPKEKLKISLAAYNGGITRLLENSWRISRMPSETQKYTDRIDSLTTASP